MSRVSIGIVNKDNRYLMVKRVKQEGNLLWVFPLVKVESWGIVNKVGTDTIYKEIGLHVSLVYLIDEMIHSDIKLK